VPGAALPDDGSDADPGTATVVVDGNNVIGTVADGWWRDRPAAVRRLLGRLQCYQQRTGERVFLVLDVPQRDLPEGEHGGIEVRYPRRRGRNAADDRILDLLDEPDLVASAAADGNVVVVTSDRALATGASDRHAQVIGARTFLTTLDRTGC
jgi:predicted RNA-binding protein with PIN domain